MDLMSESDRSGFFPRSLFDALGAELPLLVLIESSPILPLNVILSFQVTSVFLSPVNDKLPIAVLFLMDTEIGDGDIVDPGAYV